MLLICFHCAGCDSSMFTSRMIDGRKAGNALVDYCTENKITLVCPNLRGRGLRARERIRDLDDEVQWILANEFSTPDRDLKTNDWAMLGHSMGGVCCYAFYYYACVMGHAKNPKFVIISSSWDESMGPRGWPATSTLTDEEFRAELVGKWKMNPKVAETPALWEMLKERLRDDFCALEDYKALPAAPAAFPVHHLVGDKDYYIKPTMIEKHKRWITNFYKCHVIKDADHALFHNLETRSRVFEFVMNELETLVSSAEDFEGPPDETEDFVDCF